MACLHAFLRKSNKLRLLGVVVALAAALLVTACGDDDKPETADQSKSGAHDVTSDQLVMADYGGSTRTGHETFLNPFEELYGFRPVITDADETKIPLFAERGRADWDLIDTDGWNVVRWAREGLLKKLPPWVERTDVVPEEVRDYASGGYAPALRSAIRPKDEKKPVPQGWKDFFDTTKFPGKRALLKFGSGPDRGRAARRRSRLR